MPRMVLILRSRFVDTVFFTVRWYRYLNMGRLQNRIFPISFAQNNVLPSSLPGPLISGILCGNFFAKLLTCAVLFAYNPSFVSYEFSVENIPDYEAESDTKCI
jgi:hypothetical protein